MMTIAIPSDERRVLVRAFWVTLSSLMMLPWLIAAWWAHTTGLIIAGIGAAALTGVVGFVREDFTWRVYRAWNRRLVRPFASMGSQAVLAICFFVVVLVGKTGMRARHGTPAGSFTSWTSRCSLPSGAYHALFAGTFSDAASGVWVRDYVRWATQTGNSWATSLIPFLVILKLLSDDKDAASQEDIYTLF